MRVAGTLAAVVAFALAPAALAQSFPTADRYVPLRCGDRVMQDLARDQPGAIAERDLVGDDAHPTGFRAADADFLYLRMRLDVDPAPGGTPRPFAWGFALDVDDDPTDYEALIVLDGNSGEVELRRNSTTTVPDSPADPADSPPLSMGPYAQRGSSTAATDSSFAGGADAFLDLAVPWTELAALGIGPTTPVRIWVGTSTNADRLDGDIACHDGGTGAPTLDGIAADTTLPLDPAAPGGGAPGGVLQPGQTRAVEGGPGCAFAPSAAPTTGLIALVYLCLRAARTSRRRAR